MGGEFNDTRPAVSRTYKDALFRMVFGKEQSLLQLYNALNGTDYTDGEALEVVTLENAIYMNLKNDVAFLLADWLNLYEHQSTPNPNIPLRSLFYIGREYEKLVERQSLYSSAPAQIPNPRFVVFYNGVEEMAERTVLKLSDLYRHQEEAPELELKVCLLNINRGYNDAIMEQCRLLSEYMQYVDKVRTLAAAMPIDEAVERAVTESIRQGILADFLTKYRREAVQVSIFEYDEEREMRLMREMERKYWLQEGIQEGRQAENTLHIRNLMETMKLTLEQAMDALKIPMEEQDFYTAKIQEYMKSASKSISQN